jgi:ankyrin repeat protein
MHIIKFCQRVAFAIGIGMLVLPAALVAADHHNQRGALRGGAGREQRKMSPFLKRNLSAAKKCTICLEPIREGSKCALPCGHYYHKRCIVAWLEIAIKCPECRRVVPPSTMKTLGIKDDCRWKMKPELFQAVLDGDLFRVQEVLAHGGIDHNCQSSQSMQTPLHMAAACGHQHIVAWLLAQPGILIDAKDIFRKTPVVNAYQAGHKPIVEMLLVAGANPFRAACGLTLLYYAANDGQEDLLAHLLADVRLTPEILNLQAGITRQTPLMAACLAGHASIVKKLLAAGADPERPRNIHGQTTLKIAQNAGFPEVIRLIEAALIGRALLRSGRDDS